MKSRHACIAALVLSLGSPDLKSETLLSFEALPELVRERNDHVKGSEKISQAAEALRPSPLQPFYPTLKAEAGVERFERELLPQRQDPFWSATAELNVFRGGKDYLESQSLSLEASAAQLLSNHAYLDELKKTRLAYADLVYAEGLKKVLTEAQALNEKNLSSASRRRSSGMATDTDQIEFEIKRQTIQQDLEATELDIHQALASLTVLLGLKHGTKGEFRWPDTFEKISFDLSKISKQAKTTLDFQIEELESKKKDVERKIAARWWVPDVDLYGGYALHTMRDSDEFRRRDRDEVFGGVRMSLTLFNKGESLRKQKYESLISEAQQLRLSQSKRESEAELEIALKSIEKNQRLMQGAETSAASSKRYLTQTLSEYSRGVKNSPDVSAATDKYIEAQSRHLQIQKDHLIALSQLFSILGSEHPENNTKKE